MPNRGDSQRIIGFEFVMIFLFFSSLELFLQSFCAEQLDKNKCKQTKREYEEEWSSLSTKHLFIVELINGYTHISEYLKNFVQHV